MAGKINDFANDIFWTAGNTAPSGAVITNVTGAAVDFQTVANNNCFAVQNIGTVAGATFGWAGKIQEAVTATGTYADIAGATFPALTSTTGSNIVQVINFQRTQPWIRFVGTISGSASSVAIDVILGGQKGQV